MPSSIPSPARIRVTDTVALIEATQIDVMFSGDLCRLDLYTHTGTHRVTLPLHAFLEKCRGPRDSNGHEFPGTANARACLIERELAADAAAVPITAGDAAAHAPGRSPTGKHRSGHGANTTACLAAWTDLQRNPWQTVAAAALRHGATVSALTGFLDYHHPGELARLRGGQRLGRRSSEAIRRDAATAGGPMLKPSGAIL